MNDPEYKIVDASQLKHEDGAAELFDAPEMAPYRRYIEAALFGADPAPAVRDIAALPLDKRYIWRIASALKTAFADFDDWNVHIDRQTLPPADAENVARLLRARPLQFCLFLKALYGPEAMEQILLQAIATAKKVD